MLNINKDYKFFAFISISMIILFFLLVVYYYDCRLYLLESKFEILVDENIKQRLLLGNLSAENSALKKQNVDSSNKTLGVVLFVASVVVCLLCAYFWSGRFSSGGNSGGASDVAPDTSSAVNNLNTVADVAPRTVDMFRRGGHDNPSFINRRVVGFDTSRDANLNTTPPIDPLTPETPSAAELLPYRVIDLTIKPKPGSESIEFTDLIEQIFL